MQGFVAPISRLTKANKDFRRVLYTTMRMQLVVMSLKPNEEIGSEIHATHDQFFRIEKGKGRVRIGQAKIKVVAGDAFVVPAGVQHNLTNTGKKRLHIATIYAPPNHADHLIEPIKVVADVPSPTTTAAVMEAARKDMIDEGSPISGRLK
jgi:mannose-6-phosphate isomerase-like protein (cupin superfamily)